MAGGATGSGTVTLLAPSTSTNRTINLPDSNGTILTTATAGVPVNGPAFSAYQSSTQTIANATFTKIQLQTEEFDTANAFDSTTNYRFTPLVAGYYQINGAAAIAGSTGNNYIVAIFKNGSEYKRGSQLLTNTSGQTIPTVSSIVYLNGSTDYLELYGYQGSTISQTTNLGSTYQIYFNGAMVRSAT